MPNSEPARVSLEGDWLIRQLEAWPTRVDPDATTNIEYLMKEAAKRLRTPPTSPGWQDYERGLEDAAKVAEAVDSKRGNEAFIAAAIRALATKEKV